MPKKPTRVNDVNAQRDVVMGNQYNYTADLARVESLLDQIVVLLRDPHVRVEVGGDVRDSILVVGSENQVTLTKQDVGLFAKLQTDGNAARREEIYLARIILAEFADLEQLYIPLSGSLQLEPSMRLKDRADESISGAGIKLDDLRDAVYKHQKTRFVILGEPGGGKTTTLNRLAVELARDRLKNPLGGYLPVPIDLFTYSGDEQPDEFLEKQWRIRTGLACSYGEALNHDRVCFLLDGVNQMPLADRDKRIERWAHWAKRQLPNGHLAIFTCRIANYSGDLGLPEVSVNLLEEAQMRRYFEIRFGGSAYETHWREFEMRLRAGNDRFEKLARNPFMLSLMVERALEGKPFGDSRAILMRYLAEKLLTREMESGRQPETLTANKPDTLSAMFEALKRLAFAMQAEGEGTELTDALARKTPLGESGSAKISLEEVLNFARDATVLKPVAAEDKSAPRKYSFYHQLLQEYFAAERLLNLFRSGKDLSRYWRVNWRWWQFMPLAKSASLPNPPLTDWEEVVVFTAALAGRDAERLIRQVAKGNLPLAGRCTAEVKAREDLTSLADGLRTQLLKRQRSPDADLRARIDAGLALGELGHPELRPQAFSFEEKEVWAILPPMQEIPAGEFLFGSDPNDKDAYDDEKTSERRQSLPAYWMGRYAVTNAEYKFFIDAGGYQEDRWWSAEGLKWKQGKADAHDAAMQDWLDFRNWLKTQDINKLAAQRQWTSGAKRYWQEVAQLDEEAARERARKVFERPFDRPAFWDDAALANPALPVVGVNWYEASAYCAWLSAVTRREFRLPAEMEWEKAARGADGRAYPWGNEFDPKKCNSVEARILRNVPVGLLPVGASMYGVFEASGNVWEWTGNWYQAYAGQKEEHQSDAYGEKYRTVRGGSWDLNRGDVRCADRLWFVPVNFDNGIGFRLVSPGS